MPLSDLFQQRTQRLIAHEGLVVDVATWSSAHDYHVGQQRSHSMALHNAGVVSGLEVVAWEPADDSVVINPGVAVDSDGRVIVVSDPQRFRLQTRESGTVFLVLQYREVPGSSGEEGQAGSQPRYVLEAYRLEERRELPEDSFVELARIEASGDGSQIRDAADPFAPKSNEIDYRNRMISGPRPIDNISVGVVPLEMAADGQVTHLQGTLSLIRTINSTTPYHAEFVGPVNLSQEITGCSILMLAGQQEFTFADQWSEMLSNFLDRGGVLLGEACTAGPGSSESAFRQSFIGVARALGRDLGIVERGHSLLKSHYVFAEPPEGINSRAVIVETDGILYSDSDYGCLWDGGTPEEAASRESIRSATEIGVNIAIYAANRLRMRSARLVAQ